MSYRNHGIPRRQGDNICAGEDSWAQSFQLSLDIIDYFESSEGVSIAKSELLTIRNVQ